MMFNISYMHDNSKILFLKLQDLLTFSKQFFYLHDLFLNPEIEVIKLGVKKFNSLKY